MSKALHSYFSDLTSERNIDCENLTIVVDNARVPLSDEMIVGDPMGTFSQSLSAINSVSFPPPFLKETSRWDTCEGGDSSSDFSLSVPSRTWDDPLDNGAHHQRSLSESCSSLDSTERWLKELPMERPSSVTTRNTSRQTKKKKKKHDFVPASPKRVVFDDMPSLRSPYQEDPVHLYSSSRRKRGASVKLDEKLFHLDEMLDLGEELEKSELDDQRIDLFGSATALAAEVDDNSAIPSNTPEMSMETFNLIDKPESFLSPRGGGNDWPHRKSLKSTASPRALSDFPYCSPTMSIRQPRESTLGVVLEDDHSLDRILGNTEKLLDYTFHRSLDF